MAYVKKIVSKEEELVGIARLHWIYVLRGLFWFGVMAGAGWIINSLMTKILLATNSAVSSYYVANMLLTIGSGTMLFLMGGGFLVFFLFVVKVLSTEVGLTDRRVIHKEGLLFVKVHQIDHEEIRGEKLDLGWFGRLLNYGYLMLDCRFIGDVRLPAIENPERFLRALHTMRGQTQDALSVVRGKTGSMAPLQLNDEETAQQPETPQPAAPSPTPEIQPGQPGTQPEVDPGNIPGTPEALPMPTPHNPPAPNNPPPQPEAPPAQPAQPIPAPPPTEPPLQPPSGVQQSPPPDVDPRVVAQIVQQVVPQMADQVVRKLAADGLVAKAPENDNDSSIAVDTELIASFDEARGKKGGDHDMRNQMEHAIH